MITEKIGNATLYLGDCLDIIPQLGKCCVDAIITDPPYGIAVGSAFVRKGMSEIGDGSGEYNNTSEPYAWIELGANCIVPKGHCAFFISRASSSEAETAATAAGLTPWYRYFILKSAPPPTPRPCFVNAVEECIITEKRSGKRAWFGGAYVPNVWLGLTPNRLGTDYGHPTEKPLEPMLVLTKALTPESGTVLDPFMGTGTTGVACSKLGRHFIGIEKEQKYFEIACERIRKAKYLPPSLFSHRAAKTEKQTGFFTR